MNRTLTIRIATVMGAIVLSLSVMAVRADAGPVRGKPMIPVQVAIEPTVAKMKPGDIKAGDVVEFRVSARAARGSDEMTIEITLLDGAELVYGNLKWSGRVSENEEKQLVVHVRAPKTGTGRIMASVTVLRDGKGAVSKQTVYTLGKAAAGASGKPAPKATRRDSKGREVVEY